MKLNPAALWPLPASSTQATGRTKPRALAIYQQIATLLRPYRGLTLMLLVVALGSTLTEGLGIGLILPLLDQSWLGSQFLRDIPYLGQISGWVSALTLVERVRLAAVGLVVIMALRSFFSIATQLISAQLQINVEQDLERGVYHQLHAVQLGYVQQQKMGDLQTMLTYHVWQSGHLVLSVCTGLSNLFTLLIYTAAALLISWPLTLGALAVLLLLAYLAKATFSARIRASGRKEVQLRRQVRTMGSEILAGLKLVHLFGQEAWSLQRFDEHLAQFKVAVYHSRRMINLARQSLALSAVLALSALLLASSFLFPTQLEHWLTRLVLLLGIAFRLLNPLVALNWMNSQVINLAPTLEGVLDFLRRDDKPYLTDGTHHAGPLQSGVTLEEVTFRYLPTEAPVLEGISFTIPKGKMTAVVGPSGAGKSSLVHLVARLYDCEAGAIRVDGVDLRELAIHSWRSQLAVVSQEIFIFNDTVRANLEFARPGATIDELIQATQLAQAHDFIMRLPDQYETVLGDRGVRLSGGQQQRLAIARAILADPQLLIFDEATSALDSETEQALQRAIEEYGRARTLLVIAHRLSTIRQADNIIVLEGGRVAEQGTHDELMGNGGPYWRLVEAQRLEG